MFWLIASLYIWELVCLFLGERGGLCLESGRWALLHYCGNLLCLASVSIQDFFSSSSVSVWGRMKVYISWFVCLKSGIVEKETCFVRRLLLCEARSNFLSLLLSFRFCFLLHWEGDLVCETQAQLFSFVSPQECLLLFVDLPHFDQHHDFLDALASLQVKPVSLLVSNPIFKLWPV